MYVQQVEKNEREKQTHYKNHAQRLGIHMCEQNTSLQKCFLGFNMICKNYQKQALYKKLSRIFFLIETMPNTTL